MVSRRGGKGASHSTAIVGPRRRANKTIRTGSSKKPTTKTIRKYPDAAAAIRTFLPVFREIITVIERKQIEPRLLSKIQRSKPSLPITEF
jgi:hypothetical protein